MELLLWIVYMALQAHLIATNSVATQHERFFLSGAHKWSGSHRGRTINPFGRRIQLASILLLQKKQYQWRRKILYISVPYHAIAHSRVEDLCWRLKIEDFLIENAQSHEDPSTRGTVLCICGSWCHRDCSTHTPISSKWRPICQSILYRLFRLAFSDRQQCKMHFTQIGRLIITQNNGNGRVTDS